MTDTIQVCPHCDTNSGLRYRNGRHEGQQRGHYCDECNEWVEPNTREQRNKSVVGRGLASELVDMNPDDI